MGPAAMYCAFPIDAVSLNSWDQYPALRLRFGTESRSVSSPSEVYIMVEYTGFQAMSKLFRLAWRSWRMASGTAYCGAEPLPMGMLVMLTFRRSSTRLLRRKTASSITSPFMRDTTTSSAYHSRLVEAMRISSMPKSCSPT